MRTIKSKQDIEKVFSAGKRYHSKFFMMIIGDTPKQRDQSGRVAFIAGKKLGNAPLRSRCKRVLREMVRLKAYRWPNKDIVFVARAEISDVSPLYLQTEYEKLLRRANLLEATA